MTGQLARRLSAGAVDPMTTSRGAVCTAHSDHEQRGPSGRGAQRRHWLFRRGDRGDRHLGFGSMGDGVGVGEDLVGALPPEVGGGWVA